MDSLQRQLEGLRVQMLTDTVKVKTYATTSSWWWDWTGYEWWSFLVAFLALIAAVIIAMQLFLVKSWNILWNGPIRVLWIEDNARWEKMRSGILNDKWGIRTRIHARHSKPITIWKWKLPRIFDFARRWKDKYWYDLYIVDLSLKRQQAHNEWESGLAEISAIFRLRKKRAYVICYSKFFTDDSSRPYPPQEQNLRALLKSAFGLTSFNIVAKTDDLDKDIQRLSEVAISLRRQYFLDLNFGERLGRSTLWFMVPKWRWVFWAIVVVLFFVAKEYVAKKV